MFVLRKSVPLYRGVRHLSSTVHDRKTSIGLIGLGQMGAGMAKNLALKAESVYIHDVNKAAIQRLTSEYPNLKAAESPAEIAEKAATVVTMLPESAHVSNVYDSLLSAVDKDSILIDSSTIEASVARELAEKVLKKNARAFDAPVSGGILGADAGTLTFMVGAPSTKDFDEVKPMLSMMGKNVIYCGENGTGQIAKLCNNMLLAVSMIGVSEAMFLGAKLGMDPKLLASILNTSTGRCWSSDTYNPYPGVIPTAPASKEYKGGFSNKLMAKDLRLAMKAADSCKTRPDLGTHASDIYQMLATTKDFDSLDFSSIFKWISDKNNNKV